MFGVDLARWFPYNLTRTWHVQLSIFWVATAFLAAGIFLAPMIAGREPRGQHWLAYGLVGALVLVVVGSMLGWPCHVSPRYVVTRCLSQSYRRTTTAAERQP